MKRRHAIGRLLAVTSAAGWGLGAGDAVAAPAAPGEAVAWPEVTLLDGSRFGPAQAAGRALVVVFWSTTCPFCRRHNEHVEKLHRAAAGRRMLASFDPRAWRLPAALVAACVAVSLSATRDVNWGGLRP